MAMPTRIPPDLHKRLTANIHRLMARRRWKAEYLHRYSEVDKGNLSRFFNGHRDYTLLSLARIAEALEVDLAELFKPLRASRKKAAPKAK
jgi:transcriptional regulator with XRE-family HTH domain